MSATQNIKGVTIDQNFIYVQVDGKEFSIPIAKVSKKLLAATEVQKNLFIISPSGNGIHWPLINEDFSIDSLLLVAKLFRLRLGYKIKQA